VTSTGARCAAFAANIDRLRALLVDVIKGLPRQRAGCVCATALDGFDLPFPLP